MFKLSYFHPTIITVLLTLITSTLTHFRFYRKLNGLRSNVWFYGRNHKYNFASENQENQRKISDFQNVYRRGKTIWVRGCVIELTRTVIWRKHMFFLRLACLGDYLSVFHEKIRIKKKQNKKSIVFRKNIWFLFFWWIPPRLFYTKIQKPLPKFWICFWTFLSIFEKYGPSSKFNFYCLKGAGSFVWT